MIPSARTIQLCNNISWLNSESMSYNYLESLAGKKESCYEMQIWRNRVGKKESCDEELWRNGICGD